jgi:hypothetical protein
MYHKTRMCTVFEYGVHDSISVIPYIDGSAKTGAFEEPAIWRCIGYVMWSLSYTSHRHRRLISTADCGRSEIVSSVRPRSRVPAWLLDNLFVVYYASHCFVSSVVDCVVKNSAPRASVTERWIAGNPCQSPSSPHLPMAPLTQPRWPSRLITSTGETNRISTVSHQLAPTSLVTLLHAEFAFIGRLTRATY